MGRRRGSGLTVNCAHCRADRHGMLNHHNRLWASEAYPARGFRAWADDPDPDS